MACSEFSLIDRYFNRIQNTRRDVVAGIGDDCALLSIAEKKWLAVSTDTLVEGTHFLTDISPSNLGYKSLAVNLSDLASMGADPAWMSLALTLPAIDEGWVSAFSESLFQQLDYYNMQLIGGDTTRGPLSLTVTLQGFIPEGRALTRAGACIGDWIYVTGTLGDSAAGLAILQNRLHVKDTQDSQYFLSRHFRPQPRILQGLALRGIASAAIDVSDGMIMDLCHILARSNCGARINLEDIPTSAALRRNTTPDQARDLALHGGEDYELCFTVPNIKCGTLDVALSHINAPFTRIGQICPRSMGVQFIHHQKIIEYNWHGYDHFIQTYHSES
ncbi:thiamine-phosphate kinase [secondary endosymbiont of Ctenarytaina eucalypti]|uniref:Thiamine-monophosphate kinase n=1 Tax=secondary endosymbiont of Ctenarytaina eucalypti TaxID=1199245 RepID=J3TEV8_9ENTR|nr:thiamine-phosphate kinase [secondary endosymbiont of Ctenarytaina eucalypti]AFP84432.1 thiamine-monophosphate kinase [secondary endosymbiont of Ctenarytaina eucalypti]